MTTFNHTNLYNNLQNNLSHEERFFFKNRVESVIRHSPQIQCLTNSRGTYNEPVTHEYVATCVKICVCSEMSLGYVLQTACCWSSSNALQYSHMVGTQCPLAPSQSRAQLVASLPYQQLSVWATIMWIWEQITNKTKAAQNECNTTDKPRSLQSVNVILFFQLVITSGFTESHLAFN